MLEMVSTNTCNGVLLELGDRRHMFVTPRNPYGERGVLVSRNLRGPNYNMEKEHRLTGVF